MVLGRNVQQDETMCRIQEWQLCLSYFWRYLPLLYLTVIMHWFHVRSVSQILWNIFMILGRHVKQDETRCRIQGWQFCLSYFWRYLPLLYLTVIMHWFHVRSISQILWNIFMILDRNVKQDETTCRVQEWQLWLSYFWSYLSLFCLK